MRTGYTLYTLIKLHPEIKLDADDINKFCFKTACLCTSRGGTYVYVSIGGKTIALHRLIMEAQTAQYIDHINKNTLDNRKYNLRLCTNSQNLGNQELRSDNSSGYKGVTWHKGRNKWAAQIMVNRKNFYLGYYEVKEEAAKAYNRAAVNHFGEFAQLNSV